MTTWQELWDEYDCFDQRWQSLRDEVVERGYIDAANSIDLRLIKTQHFLKLGEHFEKVGERLLAIYWLARANIAVRKNNRAVHRLLMEADVNGMALHRSGLSDVEAEQSSTAEPL